MIIVQGIKADQDNATVTQVYSVSTLSPRSRLKHQPLGYGPQFTEATNVCLNSQRSDHEQLH